MTTSLIDYFLITIDPNKTHQSSAPLYARYRHDSFKVMNQILSNIKQQMHWYLIRSPKPSWLTGNIIDTYFPQNFLLPLFRLTVSPPFLPCPFFQHYSTMMVVLDVFHIEYSSYFCSNQMRRKQFSPWIATINPCYKRFMLCSTSSLRLHIQKQFYAFAPLHQIIEFPSHGLDISIIVFWSAFRAAPGYQKLYWLSSTLI